MTGTRRTSWVVLLCLMTIVTGCSRFLNKGDRGGTGATPSAFSVVASALTPVAGLTPFSVILTATVVADNPIVLYEWDWETDGVYDYSSPTSPEVPRTYTVVGLFTATIRVTDSVGNQVTASILISVDEALVGALLASTTDGELPLTVSFTPGGNTSGASIDKYIFDWGDGTFGTTIFKPQPVLHTFNVAGTYTVTLTVETEPVGSPPAPIITVTTVDITVRNQAPMATISVTPTNGPLPLAVVINVVASSGNGAVTNVDVNPGDGTAITSMPGSGAVNHTYVGPGQFQVSVTVTDSVGEVATIQSPLIDVNVGPAGSPTAAFTATPSSGNGPLLVNFDGSGSFDTGTITLYEWDFEYDGTTFTVDASGASATTTHTYNDGGLHIAALRVTDNSGLRSITALAITVNMLVTITVSSDTINPHIVVPPPPGVAVAPTTMTVDTTLSADTTVTVYITDRLGNIVRTLFNGPRTAGAFSDVWDGKDDNGFVQLDADYYAEILYELDGQMLLMPNAPSGGNFQHISSTQVLTNGGSGSNGAPFNPWDDVFWEMTADSSSFGANETTVWITPFGNGTAIMDTVAQSQVIGRGQYKFYWEAVTDDGHYINAADNAGASGGDYLWSANAWALPHNAIVIEGGRPIVSVVTATPNIVDPTSAFCGTQGADIDFMLSHDAVVTISVYSLEDASLVRIISPGNLLTGANTVNWDGKGATGDWVAGGSYRLDISATTAAGDTSWRRRALVQINY